jgi:hypothetical protein
MKAFHSYAIAVMLMGMELRTENFPSRVRCGSLDVGVGSGLGHVVMGSGISSGSHMVASQTQDFGRDIR